MKIYIHISAIKLYFSFQKNEYDNYGKAFYSHSYTGISAKIDQNV